MKAMTKENLIYDTLWSAIIFRFCHCVALGRTLNRNKQSTSIFDRLDKNNLKRNLEDTTDPGATTKVLCY